MMTKGEWNVRFLEAYRITVNLLEEIKEKTGYGHIKPRYIEVYDYAATPLWGNQGASSDGIQS